VHSATTVEETVRYLRGSFVSAQRFRQLQLDSMNEPVTGAVGSSSGTELAYGGDDKIVEVVNVGPAPPSAAQLTKGRTLADVSINICSSL
jgi:hypothetical protein